jgi:hypothetical protein
MMQVLLARGTWYLHAFCAMMQVLLAAAVAAAVDAVLQICALCMV